MQNVLLKTAPYKGCPGGGCHQPVGTPNPWTDPSTCPPSARRTHYGVGEQIALGGCPRAGFMLEDWEPGRPRIAGLSGPNDPPVSLPPDQIAWVQSALSALNKQITTTTGTTCQGWQDPTASTTAAVACFQAWYNADPNPPGGLPKLRTDGVLDFDTLGALSSTAMAFPGDIPARPAPIVVAPTTVPTVAPTPVPAKKGLSTGAIAGIAVAGVAAVGGIVFVATRGGGGGSSSGRKRRR